MKILVFYRSQEFSNAIISSTKTKLEKNTEINKALDIDFINLDKRNYIKVFSQMNQLPDYVYIWYDEEKITDYIHDTYPGVEVIHFDFNNAVHKSANSYSGHFYNDYILADMIVTKFKENLVTRKVYVVSKDFDIVEDFMNDLDIARQTLPVYNTKEDAENYCINRIKQIIEQDSKIISDCEETIKQKKGLIRKNKSLLKKFEK